MKKEIADYIKRLLIKGEPLTDTQAQAIAYWELVDFHCLEDYNNEVFTLVQGKEEQGAQVVLEVERQKRGDEQCLNGYY